MVLVGLSKPEMMTKTHSTLTNYYWRLLTFYQSSSYYSIWTFLKLFNKNSSFISTTLSYFLKYSFTIFSFYSESYIFPIIISSLSIYPNSSFINFSSSPNISNLCSSYSKFTYFISLTSSFVFTLVSNSTTYCYRVSIMLFY